MSQTGSRLVSDFENIPSHSEYTFNNYISCLDKENMLNNVIRQALADLIRSMFDKTPGGLNMQLFSDVVGE